MSAARGARILVVDDDQSFRRDIADALRRTWRFVDEEPDGARAVARLRDPDEQPYELVIADLRLPGSDGLSVLRVAREREPRTAVLLMTAFGTIEAAVEAMKEGAFDFLQKPFDIGQLELRAARAIEHGRLVREVASLRAERVARLRPDRIVGESPALRAALELARRAAPTRATVLISGETGTGKELIAGLVHALSPRASGSFVKVNCAALPETLLESELFGHERGAFTGADRTRVGRFEQADGGTLFLDEIGDMSPATQAKVLRVLQEQDFHRLGGIRVLHTDARIVVATNQDLQASIREGRFREDLYFRLNVIAIHLPPLRERPEDVVALARQFLGECTREFGKACRGFSEAALAHLQSHRWPGNVRELRNAVERAVLMAEGDRIEPADLGLRPSPLGPAASAWRPELPPDGLRLQEVERELVLEALRRTSYVQKRAAKLLGVSRRKLNYMIRRMGITHQTWRRNRADLQGESPGSLGRA